LQAAWACVPPYSIAHCGRHILFALLTSEIVSFSEQTLGSGTVSQPPVKKYGTVCRLRTGLSFAAFKQHLKSYLFNAI